MKQQSPGEKPKETVKVLTENEVRFFDTDHLIVPFVEDIFIAFNAILFCEEMYKCVRN